MAIHYFCTAGTVTAVGPTSAQLDTGTTITGTVVGANLVMTNKLKQVRLIRMAVLVVPGTADVVSVTDAFGNALFSITVPTSSPPKYDFGGIPVPLNGILVSTTQATGAYCFVIDADASIV